MKILNNRYVIWISVPLLTLIIASPFIIWKLQKASELDVLVLSDDQLRVKGIEIVLENSKKVSADGESFNVKNISTNFNLLNKHDFNLVFISSINEGLAKENLLKLKNFLVYKGGNVAFEHSLFDLSTSDEVRYELETLSNVRWSGWKGISYNTDNISDLPQWIFDLYEKRYTIPLDLGNKGVVFINAFNDDIVVANEQFIDEKNSPLQVLDKNKTLVNEYLDWFTVFEPVKEEEVLSSFQLNISDEGIEMLNKHGVPVKFPAVIRHEMNNYNMLTYAGEFIKIKDKNLMNNSVLQKLLNKNLAGTAESEPFWNVFKPTLETLLEPVIKKEKARVLTYIESDYFTYNTRSRFGEQFIEIHTEEGWKPLVIKGVNIGMGVPGYFPGEAAVSEAQYFRWFKQITDMNANSFRVYTLQSPSFYKALYEYNQIADEPLYFFHGAWVVEEYISEFENMFMNEITEPFYEEISYIIDAVYGNVEVEEVPGHAFGQYMYDVSDYLLGWIVGIEFSGETVLSTNEKNSGMSQYDGKYFKTNNAAPFEIWLAQSLDYTADYEIQQYKKAHILSYTNWPTTDIFNHPLEFNIREDLDKVDPNLIIKKESFIPGQFYSFHIYPYYPDFIDAEYSDYIDKSGKNNSYAGYLNVLKKHMNMPSIITEFGIPASRGITHTNKLGRNQGGHSETSQGEHLVSLYTDILDENYGGGLVFTWQDEWFKRTWNTMDYDDPDRRPYWSNFQTNEQYFGVLSFESGRYNQAIQIDGNENDWEVLHSEPLYQANEAKGLSSLYVHHDARYLYLKLNYNHLDTSAINTKVYFDTLLYQGNTRVELTNYEYSNGIDFVLDIKNYDEVELFVDSYYDAFYYMNEKTLRSIDEYEGEPAKNSGKYNPLRLILSAMYKGIQPDGGTYIRPYEESVTGKLVQGNSIQNSADYNSIADYYINTIDGIIEIRLPWLMLNFRDPSQKEAIKDIYASDVKEIYGEFIEGINVFATNQIGSETYMLPEISRSKFDNTYLNRYEWTSWDHPPYHERLKSSYSYLQDLFAKIN